jgi:Uma2 family endonuclease
MGLAVSPRVSYAEYLAKEASADVRHEYVAGRVVAMAGGSIEHGRLMAQLALLLGIALRGRGCVVLPSDVRVRIRAADRATYPDLFIVCGTVERDPDDPHAVVNPVVVVEILSESSAEEDRGDKFADYRRLRSLREYVLVSQRDRRIDVYHGDGRRWVLDEHGPGDRARLEAIGVDIAVDEVYADELGAIVA